MPPIVSRKRVRSSSPDLPPPAAKGKGKAAVPKGTKRTVFDAVDAPAKKRKTHEETKKLLEELNGDDDESLSEVDSDDFEDVPPAKRRKTAPKRENDDEEDEDEDEEMDWEDAIQHPASAHATPGTTAMREDHEIADISFTVKEDGSYVDPGVSVPGLGKKGPSKREKIVRIRTHCLHVQAMLWHNTVRNSWLNDKQVQRTLVDSLTKGVKREVTRWRESMGTLTKEELEAKKKATAAKGKGKRGRKGKEKSGRDWNFEAEHVEQGVPNLSAGDPLLRLLKVLTAYWRKRFTITAPGLRKQGYMPMRRLGNEVKDWVKSMHDAEEHGERIENVEQFRKLAKDCEGSRDVGAQLFAALLRGLGLETRMVANLQPPGLGWSKSEEADAEKVAKKEGKGKKMVEDAEVEEVNPEKAGSGKKAEPSSKGKKPMRNTSRDNKAKPIDLEEDSDIELSNAPSAPEPNGLDDDDDLSVVDITPPTPPKQKPNMKYDRDLAFPIYWVEVCSPVSQKYIPVDPIVLCTIASNDELLQTFEPRGKKSELAKQVMAYTIAFNADGTAKDVTVRYLKKHQLPGKTKGMRMPAEKLPIFNRKGKVKRYEEYDWFRTVMSLYDRPERKRTAADDLEEQTDLLPAKPAKEAKEVQKESLQWYKASAEFALEQHLRREEALLPGAKSVKTFTVGKGDKAKVHAVFLRVDVVACKTVESWHKEGRAIKVGEQPMKLVAIRAVTLIRKREIEDAQKETGEKPKQGLYSIAQTDWIIPPPIKDGRIPKNTFGNMDVYVPTMVPRGGVHLPLKGSAKLCRRLEIDYAEACTGFEFGKHIAVPVLTGVVVAEEHELLVRDAWRAEQKEVKRKGDEKRMQASLHLWRKMVLGLSILNRMRVEYADAGGGGEEVNPFVAKAKRQGRAVPVAQTDVGAGDDDMGAGGFFPPGHEEEEVPHRRGRPHHDPEVDEDDGGVGGFLVEDGAEHGAGDGGFLVESDADDTDHALKKYAPVTPVSLQSMHKAADVVDDEDDEDVEMEDVAPKVDTRKPTLRVSRGKTNPKPKPTTKAATTKSKRKSVAPPSHDEDDVEMYDAPARSTARKPATKTSNPKPTRKAVTPPSENKEADDSSLSELDDVYEEDSSSGAVHKAPTKNQVASPRVVVTRGVKKSTPLKSQYFVNSSESEEEERGGEEESEAEVVSSRRTTARTRARS
ncbi:hypothetical protein LTR08_007216 [Meristemomyces frigidus]|nr:hypothetical protein LTR08_007216 [Meristemomyces frigidus]